MAVALTADEVGQIVSYIAPGFAARRAYAGRFPHPDPSEMTLLVSSVVLSLPIVALAVTLGPAFGIDEADPTDLAYVTLLLGIAVLGGYAFAAVRALPRTRAALAKIGLAYQPEGSVWAQALLGLPADAVVTVEFTDGRKLSGTPSMGPALAGSEPMQLCLTHPAWWDPHRQSWVAEGAGGAVIVPLDQIHSVTVGGS
jgi:uncharacterized protein DUF6338